jgi:shikimate kinase
MQLRAPLYESIAAVVVTTDGRHVRMVAEEILRKLKEPAAP